MKTIASILAVALSIAFAAPALAGATTPKTKAECEKAGMQWNASSKTCVKKSQ